MKKAILITCTLLSVFILVGVVSAAGEVYTHPSGAFTIDEFGALTEETETGALFETDSAQLMVLFGPAQVELLTEETLPGFVSPMLDSIQEFDDYSLDTDNIFAASEGEAGAYWLHFTVESETSAYTAGDVFVAQQVDMLYTVILLAEDYEAVQDDWLAALDSFTLGAAAPVEEIATPAPTPAPAVKGTTSGVVASGFEPDVNGFSFENYGNESGATNLTAAELQRMFGDGVCASVSGGECILTPPAEQWMEQINNYLDGGHCEGMAVLSSLMYYDQVDPVDFGGDVTAELEIAGNDPLQREIAYWWTTQATYPGASLNVNESPAAVLAVLLENFNQGKKVDEWWALGFYKRDGSGGHAVTPIGVEDLGDGLYNLQVYDNNYPGELRNVEIDLNTNSWQYEGSPNPEIESDLYEGDADTQTLEVVAISPRLDTQACDFCAGVPQGESSLLQDAATAKLASPLTAGAVNMPWQQVQQRWELLINGIATDFYQIWLTGKADLLIIDDWGRRIGLAEDESVNEIPGATETNMRIFQQPTGDSLDKDKSPVYRIPVGLSFEVVVDGVNLPEGGVSDVSLIGPGYYLDVSDIWLEPGEADSIGVFIHQSRHQLTYYTDYAESPDIELGLETPEADYAMLVRATELVGVDDSFVVAVDMETNEFILNTSYNTDASTYEVYVLRIDDEGEMVFGADDVVLEPDNTAYIAFAAWEEGAGLPVQFDYENDGEIDDEIELPDVTGTIDFYAEGESDVVEAPPAAEFEVPAGKALFVFYNDSSEDFTVEVGAYALEVAAGEIGTQALTPGSYDWEAYTEDGDYLADEDDNTLFEFTVAAGDMHEAGVE